MGVEGEIVRISLPNDSKLGIAITPPKHGVTVRGLKIDKVQNELFVGRISHGDLLLEIGGVKLDGMKFADAVNLIKTMPRPLELTFEIIPPHLKKMATTREGGEEVIDKIPSYNVVLDGDKIGFQLDDGSRLGIDGTVVKAVRDQAEDAGIAVGDIVYKVNGTEVLFMSLKQVQKLIKATLPPRSLDFIPKANLEEVQRMNQELSAMEKQLRLPIPKHEVEEKSITEIIKEHRATKIKEGPMYKQGRVVKNWKLRHVVLRVTKLEYFKDARDKIPQGIVDFENCRCTVRSLPSAVKTPSTPGGHLLELAAGDRVLVMSCTTDNEKADWLEALRVAIDASKAVTRQESSLGYNQDPSLLRRDETILHKTFKSIESSGGNFVKRRESIALNQHPSHPLGVNPPLTTQLSIQAGDASHSAVKIEVCAVANLTKAFFHVLNPYCEVTLGAETFKTPVVRDTLNPVWNEDNKVVFGVLDDDAVVEIRVFDERSFRGSELLSTLTIPLSSLPPMQKIEHTYPLILADRSAHASITMKLEFSYNSTSSSNMTSQGKTADTLLPPPPTTTPPVQGKNAFPDVNLAGLTQDEIDQLNEMSDVADAEADDASRIAKQAQELANSLIEDARRKAEMAIEAAQLEAMGQKAAAEEARAAAKLAREQADLQMAAARKAQEELHEAQKRRQLIRSGSTAVNLGGSSGGQSGGFGQFLAYRTMFVREKVSEEEVRAKMVSDGIDDEQITHFFEGIKDYRAKMAELEQQVETLKRERSVKKREEEDASSRPKEPSAADMLQSGTISSDQEKILRRLLKLEKQLQQAGIVVAEDIPYEEAKKKVEEISRRMGEIGSADVTHPDVTVQKALREEYFKLEQDMEKYNGALMLTDEYAAEQDRKEREWEEENREANEKAIRAIRRMMPVDVKSMSEAQLQAIETSTGQKLTREVALKFKRTNVLEILRSNPMDLQKNHPSLLDGLRVTGLTVTERRALYVHLRDVAETWKAQQKEEMAGRKYAWFKSLKDTFKTAVGAYNRHVAQYGPPGNHPYATRDDPGVGCPMIGKQCPLKADAAPAYNLDLGFPEGPVYQQVNVTLSTPDDAGAAAKAELEKLKAAKNEAASIERENDLKEHYKHIKGNTLVMVKGANGACENLSELVDKVELKQRDWLKKNLDSGEPSASGKKAEVAEFDELIQELRLKSNQFAERSGMYLQGRRNPDKDTADTRSFHELNHVLLMIEAIDDCFAGLDDRMKKVRFDDEKRLRGAMKTVTDVTNELKTRSQTTLKALGPTPALARKLKSRAELLKEVKAERVASGGGGGGAAAAAGDEAAPARPPHPMMGGRGRGGNPLLAAINAKKKGDDDDDDTGRRPNPMGGRGRGNPLMAAIAARKKGGDDGDSDPPPARPANPLMAAIAARKKPDDSGDGAPPARPANPLMAAIAARKKPDEDEAPVRPVNPLMAAIAARKKPEADDAPPARPANPLMAAIAARKKVE